jgi:hypothetical protein
MVVDDDHAGEDGRENERLDARSPQARARELVPEITPALDARDERRRRRPGLCLIFLAAHRLTQGDDIAAGGGGIRIGGTSTAIYKARL